VAHTPEEVRKHLKVYWTIFGSLLVLTAITVAVSYVHLGTARNIAVGIFIAAVKASLVMLFFMHLKGERKGIFWTLYLTFFFFLCLIWIPIFGSMSQVTGTIDIQPAAAVSDQGGHGEEHAGEAHADEGHGNH
jgi:cytochrome c oxidase subunit 4